MFYFIDNLAGADPDLDLYLDPDPKKRFSGLGFRAQFFILGKPLRNKGGVQTEFCQIAFQPPQLFSPKISKFPKTAALTLGTYILTKTKHCSYMVF